MINFPSFLFHQNIRGIKSKLINYYYLSCLDFFHMVFTTTASTTVTHYLKFVKHRQKNINENIKNSYKIF